MLPRSLIWTHLRNHKDGRGNNTRVIWKPHNKNEMQHLFVSPAVQFQDCQEINVCYQGKLNAAAKVFEFTWRAIKMNAAKIQRLLYEKPHTKTENQHFLLHPPFDSRITLKSKFFHQGKLDVAAKVSELIWVATKMIATIIQGLLCENHATTESQHLFFHTPFNSRITKKQMLFFYQGKHNAAMKVLEST